MCATDSTGITSPGNLIDAPRLPPEPLGYGRGRTIHAGRIPLAVGLVAVLVGVHQLHHAWLVTRVLVPHWASQTVFLQPMSGSILAMFEPASGFVLVPAGIALALGYRWPMLFIGVWEALVLAMFSRYFASTLWAGLSASLGLDAWQMLDRLSILSAGIFPVFAVCYGFRSPTDPLQRRRRASIALALAGLVAGLSRLGGVRFGKLALYLMITRSLRGDFSSPGEVYLQASTAVAYLILAVLTVSAAIRLLRRQAMALVLLQHTELAYLMLVGFFLSQYFAAFRWRSIIDPAYRLDTIYTWLGSLHQIVYPTLGLLMFHALGDEPQTTSQRKPHVAN